MIPSSTIDFDVVEARQKTKWSKCGCGKSFVLIHLSRQIELDEPWERGGGCEQDLAFGVQVRSRFVMIPT